MLTDAFHPTAEAARKAGLHQAALTGLNHHVVDTVNLPTADASMRYYVTPTPVFQLHPDCLPLWTCTPNGVAS